MASISRIVHSRQHHHYATAAKCPELNPVENIWQYMRDNWLSNRVDIVDHCCYAWNTLIVRISLMVSGDFGAS